MGSSSSATTFAAGAPATPLDLVSTELVEVEKRIAALCVSPEKEIERIAAELISSGGKRVRPALVLLTFRAAGGSDPTDAIDIGAAIELIHSATLLHDDIIDAGQTRRGMPSPLARYGLGRTLVAGDFLFSKAFGVAGRFDETIVGWATDACVELCEGEVLQQRFRRNPEVTLPDYEQIAACKTASLFRQAARIGAHLAGASENLVRAMHQLGMEIGIAFQMVDDLLDVVGPEAVIGKPVGSDLREGSPSLPIVLSLPRLRHVAAVFRDPSPTPQAVEKALEEIRRSGVLTEVRAHASRHIEQGRAEIGRLEPSPFRDALTDLVDALLARTA